MKFVFTSVAGTRNRLRFRMLNTRDDSVFHLFGGGVGQPKLLASSNTVAIAPDAVFAPHAGRIALTQNDEDMVVSFTTKVSATPNAGGGVVQFGTSPGPPYERMATAVPSNGGGDAYSSAAARPSQLYLLLLSSSSHGSSFYRRRHAPVSRSLSSNAFVVCGGTVNGSSKAIVLRRRAYGLCVCVCAKSAKL